MFKLLNAFVIVIVMHLTLATAPSHVAVLITSQDTGYHRRLADKLRADLHARSAQLGAHYAVEVSVVHEIFNQPGDWTILTALPHLVAAGGRVLNDHTRWIILCEESTHIELGPLLERLESENHTECGYLGHPLYDQEATIIHHFAFFENPRWFPYPMLRSGVVFTAALFRRMAALVPGQRRTEFAIDAAHELARFIMDNVRGGESDTATAARPAQVASTAAAASEDATATGRTAAALAGDAAPKMEGHFANMRTTILKGAAYICPAPMAMAAAAASASASLKHARTTTTLSEADAALGQAHGQSACLMYAQPMDTSTCRPVRRHQVYFAIKTCQRFHKERLPIIESTWAPYATHKRYFSDVADADIPTNSTGVPNAETGHCAKTLAILKLALKDIRRLNRATRQQSQRATRQRVHMDYEGDVEEDYEKEDVEATLKEEDASDIRWLLLTDDDTLLSVSGVCDVLGCFDPQERIYLGERYGYQLHASGGFDYVTGGGGIALSLPAVRLIVAQCSCPAANAPDDMVLGACLAALQVPAVHSARFHQARPNDYAAELLALEAPVSFHKFWQLDPLAVYAHWFAPHDRQMALESRGRLKMEAQRRATLLNASKECRESDRGDGKRDTTAPHCGRRGVASEQAAATELGASPPATPHAKHLEL